MNLLDFLLNSVVFGVFHYVFKYIFKIRPGEKSKWLGRLSRALVVPTLFGIVVWLFVWWLNKQNWG